MATPHLFLLSALLLIVCLLPTGEGCPGSIKKVFKKSAFKLKGTPKNVKVSTGGRPKGLPKNLAPGYSVLADVTKKAARAAPKKPPVNLKRTLAVGAAVGVAAGAAAAAGGGYVLMKRREEKVKAEYAQKAMDVQSKIEGHVASEAARLQKKGAKIQADAAAAAAAG